MNTPVLILAWRRPDYLLRLITALRDIKPLLVYVSVDGPRNGNSEDMMRVKECISVLTRYIDWDCRLKLLASASNKGCKQGVRSGIDWFFSNVREGIVLEDDCIPHPCFFAYCETLLEHYRHNDRVAFISGDNSHGIVPAHSGYTYTFIRTPLVWGWATWSKVWFGHDRHMIGWKEYARMGHSPTLFYSQPEHNHMCKIYDSICETGFPDTWDYQLAASILLKNQLCVLPRENLISNIGFGSEATHTKAHSRKANSATYSLRSINHPPRVELDLLADRQVYSKVHMS